uniref:Uncharacterized protein n=1 Tax=Solanum lycopersicum TaxID=4081 RepID=K4CKA6_SOLLC
MQKELDNLKDVMNIEKKNLEMAFYECDKFNTMCYEKDVELKVFEKIHEELKAR